MTTGEKTNGNTHGDLKESNNDRIKKVQSEDDEDIVEYKMAEPPDGGWGWVVVFSSFMIHVIADGVTYTFGIFYMEFLKHFKESKGYTSWVASIMVGVTFCVGPIASGLTNKFGCRTVTIIGSLLASFGLIMSTFAPNVLYLFFTVGLCTGAGFGLMYLPAIVCVTCYFEKKRAFATGVAVCGSGIGTFALAPITEWLVDEYGWEGAMLIVAGMVLNCCVFGALFRPLEKVAVKRRPTLCSATSEGLAIPNELRKGSLPNGAVGTNGEVKFGNNLGKETLEHSRSAMAINLQMRRSSMASVRTSRSMTLQIDGHDVRFRRSGSLGPLNRKDIFYSGNLGYLPEYNLDPNVYSSRLTVSSVPQQKKEEVEDKGCLNQALSFLCPLEMREAFQEMMNFRLMLDVIFLMFGFSNFFTNIGFNVPFVYTKDRAVQMELANERYASYLISVIGIANTVGRVILGYLSDITCINRLWLYNGSLTLCGLSTAFSSFCADYDSMAMYAVVFGATAGAYVSLTSVILVDLLGLEKLTNAFGLLLVFEGVACLIGPPITGWLHDYTGSYDPGFYVSGAMIALSGLMLFFIPCVQRMVIRKQEKNSGAIALQEVPSDDTNV